MPKVVYYSPYGGTVLAVLADRDPEYEAGLASAEGGQQKFKTAKVTDADAVAVTVGGIYKEG